MKNLLIPRDGIFLSMSGGGYRAAARHLGSLICILQHGLLPNLRLVSSVSGGSITAGYLAKWLAETGFQGNPPTNEELRSFSKPLLQFLIAGVRDRALFGIPKALLPNRAGALEAPLESGLFGATQMAALAAVPRFVICVTDTSDGEQSWISRAGVTRSASAILTHGEDELRRSSASPTPDLTLARAVAASASYPVFPPVTMSFSAQDYLIYQPPSANVRRAAMLRAGKTFEFGHNTFQPGERTVLRHFMGNRPVSVRFSDGGLSDNLGVSMLFRRVVDSGLQALASIPLDLNPTNSGITHYLCLDAGLKEWRLKYPPKYESYLSQLYRLIWWGVDRPEKLHWYGLLALFEQARVKGAVVGKQAELILLNRSSCDPEFVFTPYIRTDLDGLSPVELASLLSLGYALVLNEIENLGIISVQDRKWESVIQTIRSVTEGCLDWENMLERKFWPIHLWHSAERWGWIRSCRRSWDIRRYQRDPASLDSLWD